MTLKNYYEYLVSWIQEQVTNANLKGVIVGLSGGVDSSVVAALAKAAFPQNSLGVYLPINNMGRDYLDAKEVAKKLKLNTDEVDLTEAFNGLKNALFLKNKLAMANINPRLRMTALYALAQEKKYLVLGTDNAAEWMLGYFTKFGDGGVDLLPIVNLTKGEVKAMAKMLGLPKAVYTKAPTAGLWEGQTDEEELGFSYYDVDKYLKKEPIDPIIENKIKHQINITQHKRIGAPMPKEFNEKIIF